MKYLRFLAFLVLTSCTYVPPQEFILYQSAFNEAYEATNGLLDVYNGIEKKATNTDAGFLPDEAALIAPNADAPITSLYRRGFHAIAQYNVILARYAAGESISALDPDLNAFQNSISRLGAALNVEPAAAASNSILGLAKTLAKISLADSDAAAFRESILNNSGPIKKFLESVRLQTTAMYTDAVNAADRRTAADALQSINDLAIFRQSLASWVLLIDETLITLDALEHVIEQNSGQRAKITILAASTDRLASYAEEIDFMLRQLGDSFSK